VNERGTFLTTRLCEVSVTSSSLPERACKMIEKPCIETETVPVVPEGSDDSICFSARFSA
jgi:hypothetical protein